MDYETIVAQLHELNEAENKYEEDDNKIRILEDKIAVDKLIIFHKSLDPEESWYHVYDGRFTSEDGQSGLTQYMIDLVIYNPDNLVPVSSVIGDEMYCLKKSSTYRYKKYEELRDKYEESWKLFRKEIEEKAKSKALNLKITLMQAQCPSCNGLVLVKDGKLKAHSRANIKGSHIDGQIMCEPYKYFDINKIEIS